MQLGRDFAQQIGNGLSEADLFLSGAGKLELAEHRSGTQIPDNEPLLLHGIVTTNYVNLKQDIYTVKRGHTLMVSLGDFCSAADLAISVNPKDGTAGGWFMREDQTFRFDAKKAEAVIMGKTMKIDPKEIDADGNDILVSTALLEKWFGLEFDYNFADLALLIKTTQPLPVEESYLRSQRRGGGRIEGDRVAKLPTQETPYALLSQPYFDTNMNSTITHAPGQPAAKTGSWSTIVNNDFAGFNAQSFASGDAVKPYLDTLRLTLGKQDPDGGLLGPLHATGYQFGDVNGVSIPLIGGGGKQEQGVSITNNAPDTTTQTSTDIQGNAQPGWDVELYRNEVRLDIRHVGTDGVYQFKNIDLLVGDNDFKLLFYGPRGEIREEHRKMGVSPDLLTQHTGHYSISATRNGITTWQPTPPTEAGAGDPNITAFYEQNIGKLGTANFGIRRHSDDGVERTFAQTGLASYLYDTYFNTDIGVNAGTGASAETFTARHSFGRQSALFQYTRNSEGYDTSSPTANASLRESYRLSSSGPLPGRLTFTDRVNYNLTGQQSYNYDGSTRTNLNSGLTTRFKSVLLSNGFSYNESTSATGDRSTSATTNFSGRGFAYGGSWRLESSFNVLPRLQLTDNLFEYSHSIGENVDTLTQIEYKPTPRFASAQLSLNWRTPKATISPNVSVDTNKNIAAGVDVHFGLGAEPYSHSYGMYSAYLSGTGGVAARVFLDKNGDGIFNSGDELMPDVVIRALQAHREATSNERGIAFIPDLEQNRLTDVVVDQTSFPDPYDISLFDGLSIRPHPGSVSQIEFPVVVGGEMDGPANYTDNTTARNAQITLSTLDGVTEKSVAAAYDGYWAISSIKPGVYYLGVDAKNMEEAAYMIPEKIIIPATGATIYGHAANLIKGYKIPFRFSSVDKPKPPLNRARVEEPEDAIGEEVLLHLGPYHSRLGLTFSWYKFKIRSLPWGRYFDLVTPLSKIKPDPKTAAMDIVLKPQQPLDTKGAAAACQELQDMKFDCSVEVVTHYAPEKPAPSVGAIDDTGKKG